MKSMASKKKVAAKRQAWNKGLEVGKRDGFAAAIDTMLHGHSLLTLVVGDVQSRNGSILPLIEVAQSKGAPPVRCALSKSTTIALEKWITAAGLKHTDYLFPGAARSVS